MATSCGRTVPNLLIGCVKSGQGGWVQKFERFYLFPALRRHVRVSEGAEDPSEQPGGAVVERVGGVRRRVQHGLQRVRAPRVEPQEVVPI